MPTVPVVDQTAMNMQPLAAPAVQPERNDAPAQLEQAGQAVQQAGSVAMKTGQTIGDTLANQVDEATVKQAEAATLGKMQSINYDPQSGFMNQKGQNAINGYRPAVAAVSAAVADGGDGLTNPIQKLMYHQAMQPHVLSFNQQMAQHSYQETSQFSGEAAVSRATMSGQMAVSAAASYGQTDGDGNPTGDFAKNLATSDAETLKATQILKGAPEDSDVARQALLNSHTAIGVGVVSQLMDAHASYAKVQSVFDDLRAKGMLTIAAQDTLGKMVKTYTDGEVVRTAVNDSLSNAFRASQGQPTSSTGTPDYQTSPIKGATVTSQPYDPDHGVVVVNAPNASSIQAPADGKVIAVGKDDNGTFGMHIQHADGSVTTFSGLGASNVAVGDSVQRGEQVGTSGAPAVLWSLADKNGNAVDPTKAGLAPVDLTKVTDEKVLGAALNDVRSRLQDPVQQQEATSELESFVRHNQSMANAQATQNYKAASDAFSPTMNWQSIPASLFSSLTGEQQREFKDKTTQRVLQNYQQSQEFKGMSAAGIEYNFAANPASLTVDAVNRATANGQLPDATAIRLMNEATARAKDPQSVQEATDIAGRIKYFAAPSGVNVEPKTPADKQIMTDLTYKVSNAVDQIKTQNKGKATAQQVDDAIKQQLIQHTVGNLPHAAWNPLVFTGMESNVAPKQFQFQMPTGATQVMRGSDGQMHYVDSTGKQDLGVVK